MSPTSLHSLFERYRQTLPDKLMALEELRSRINESDVDVIRELRLAVHRLSGSAGSYGYPDLGDLARRVEECVNQTQISDWSSPEFRAALKAELAALIGLLERLIEERG